LFLIKSCSRETLSAKLKFNRLVAYTCYSIIIFWAQTLSSDSGGISGDALEATGNERGEVGGYFSKEDYCLSDAELGHNS